MMLPAMSSLGMKDLTGGTGVQGQPDRQLDEAGIRLLLERQRTAGVFIKIYMTDR